MVEVNRSADGRSQPASNRQMHTSTGVRLIMIGSKERQKDEKDAKRGFARGRDEERESIAMRREAKEMKSKAVLLGGGC